jgi:hypothetical protein
LHRRRKKKHKKSKKRSKSKKKKVRLNIAVIISTLFQAYCRLWPGLQRITVRFNKRLVTSLCRRRKRGRARRSQSQTRRTRATASTGYCAPLTSMPNRASCAHGYTYVPTPLHGSL